MFTHQSHPEVARAAIQERMQRAPRTGTRRSARLISIEIRRARRAERSR